METRAYVDPQRSYEQTLEYMRAASPIVGHAAPWYFFRSYVTAALWSSNDDNDFPLDQNYDISDIAPTTRAAMLIDCAKFYHAHAHSIHCNGAPQARDVSGLSMRACEASQAGHDFWLTRCGHGAGFWDGDWPEPAATALTAASEAFGNVDLYIGDNGRIYA